MGDSFEDVINGVEYCSPDGQPMKGKRYFAVVDGRNNEFRNELEKMSIKRAKECYHIKDPRTGCWIRYYKVHPSEGDIFQKAVVALSERMPALGYPNYEPYCRRVLIDFGCISPEESTRFSTPGADNPVSIRTPDSVFNCCFFRMDFPRCLFWQDFLVVEGRAHEALHLLEQRGFTDLRVRDPFAHKKWPNYVAFSCTVPKKRILQFIDAMREMDNRMIILGYRDYESACEAIFSAVSQMAESA